MKIESLLIKGFRCFPEAGEGIELGDLTCLVGPNASGKTATLTALARMFGETQSERTLKPSDFHLVAGESLGDKSVRHLSIEVKLTFPGLDADAEDAPGVPETFNQMVVNQPGGSPYCRIRLEGTWTNDETALGDVQQRLSWICTPSDDPEVVEKNRRKVDPTERSRIKVTYIPAARDPSAQIRISSATTFGRMIQALEWGDKQADLKDSLIRLKNALDDLPGIGTLNSRVQNVWQRLYDGRVAANLTFESVEPDPQALVELLAPVFAPDETGHTLRSSDLSDGLRALFALSLPLGLHRLEEELKTDAASLGFQANFSDHSPLISVFAVEEPENHLSPHYLGKVIRELCEVAKTQNTQVLISSHSPCIMSRVEPDDVRYFLGGENQAFSSIVALDLPSEQNDESYKYVREAVKGFPELYFSRLVVLGEGASEEIVLRKLFEDSGRPLDSHFISVVPLGGRHVNHFWRLLDNIKIPFITLLDLDNEKDGGGWGRLQYAWDQVVKLDPSSLLANVAFSEIKVPAEPDKAKKFVDGWLEFFEREHNVFFSAPLDLDFSLLESFTAVYQSQAPLGGGPRLPTEDAARKKIARNRMRQVLSKADQDEMPADLGDSYSDEQAMLFPWYKYLFLDGSKPVAHLRAMASLAGTGWTDKAPRTLTALVRKASSILTKQKGNSVDETVS